MLNLLSAGQQELRLKETTTKPKVCRKVPPPDVIFSNDNFLHKNPEGVNDQVFFLQFSFTYLVLNVLHDRKYLEYGSPLKRRMFS